MAPRPLSEVSVGDVVGPVTVPVTRDTLVAYANASGDQNPIHQDESFARSVGLPDVIAHGMWTMGASGTVVADWAGDAGRVVEFGTRFTKPVVVPVSGTELVVQGVVKVGRRRDGPGDRRRHDDLWGREGARPVRRGRAAELMRELHDEPIAAHTTMRVGGPAARMVVAETADELVDAVREVDDAQEPLLVLGGGSNLVVADQGFEGTVVKVATRGVVVDSQDQCGGANVVVAAGEDWDGLVARAVEEGWSGIEALSGIPGSTGATPVQNVGAYGQEVAQTIARVRVWDRTEQRVRTMTSVDCRFSYRHSVFKDSDRYVVLDVMFQLVPGTMSQPVRYADLAAHLGIEVGGRVPLGDARAAVLAQRRRRGMVLDAPDHDTWSCGSFFTNPVLSADDFAALEAQGRAAAGVGGRCTAEVSGRRRPGQDERRVAHRAGRLRQGLRDAGARRPVDQAHAGGDQPR